MVAEGEDPFNCRVCVTIQKGVKIVVVTTCRSETGAKHVCLTVKCTLTSHYGHHHNNDSLVGPRKTRIITICTSIIWTLSSGPLLSIFRKVHYKLKMFPDCTYTHCIQSINM